MLRDKCGARKTDVSGGTPELSIAPGALVPLAGDRRLRGPDRDQRQRLGWSVHGQQPLQVVQCLAQAFATALLPTDGPGDFGTADCFHGRASKKF